MKGCINELDRRGKSLRIVWWLRRCLLSPIQPKILQTKHLLKVFCSGYDVDCFSVVEVAEADEVGVGIGGEAGVSRLAQQLGFFEAQS